MSRRRRGVFGAVKWSLLLMAALAYLSTAQARSEYPPEILKQPFAGQAEFEGNTKLLRCQVVAVPDPVFTWIKDDTPVHVNRTVNYLRLGNLSLSDSGVYRCLVSNKLGAVLSEGAHIRVAAFRQFSKTPPQEKTVDQGQSLILDLPPINTLLLTVSWQENNSTIRAHEAMHHSITLTHQLVLLSIDNNINNKQYRAMVEDSLSKGFLSFSSSYIIRVQDTNNPSIIHPQIVVPPVDTFANVGDDAKLECVINARPMSGLSITWYRLYENGTKTRIESGGKYLLTGKTRLLYVRTITKSDSGTYVCEGLLTAGQTPIPSVSHSANLTVQVIPKITVNPRSSTVERDFGQEVTLACEAEGVPKPTLEWFFNGRPISSINSDRYQVFANGSLQMTHLDLPYSGKYQCFATNPTGETYLSANLHINSAPPQITKFPENLTVVEKSDARFFCEVTGAPTPQITWKKVAGGVEQPVTPGTRFQVTRSYLLITDVQKDDSGVYRCSAENIKGQQAAEAHLSVITKTQVVRPPQNQTVILSTRVSFECGVTRDEHTVPVWEWFFYKNSELSREAQLSSTGRYQILANGTLMVSGVSAQDIGLYKCHVISAGGNDSRVAFLSVIELPRPPTITSVQLNTNENNSVVVTWTKAFDGNSPLLKYIIIYRQENPNGNNDGVGWEVYPDRIPADATTYIVSNLSPSRYYRFRISAVNVVGESNGSQPMPNPAIKMPTQPPSSPPRNFFCTQGGQGEIRATWDPPEESTWNGDLQGYLLRYMVANLNTVLEEARVTGASKRSFLIQHLVPFKQYAVTIAAFNEEGTGASTNSFFVWTREGRPTDAPKNVVANASSSTVVQLHWDPPDPWEIYGRNLGYTIEIRHDGELVRSFFVGSNASNLFGRQQEEITGLSKFTEYSIIIACRTAPGLGPYSSPVDVKTMEDVPGPVRELKFDNIQDRSLRVTWSEPSEVNGILTGYVLKYERKNQASSLETVKLLSSLTSYTIRQLDPVTNYTIYVSATTQMGEGEDVSADIQSGVPPELPHPPDWLATSNFGARQVLLQFEPGFDGKTSITLWIVLARQVDNPGQDYEEIFSISAPNADRILVQNLQPYTRYQLKLIAENIVGRSAPSKPTEPFQTVQAPPGAPPGNVTMRPINATSFRISWTPVLQREWNGVPRGYRIDYRMWSTEPEDAGVETVQQSAWTTMDLKNGVNLDSYNLLNLEEWMDYQLRMISHNDAGDSAYSPVTTARTRESTPSASPSDLSARPVSSTEILVTWQPVPRLQQNGQILGYKVLYEPSDFSGPSMFADVKGKNKLNVTLDGLHKYVSYMIRIRAYTRMGDGRLSEHLIRRTFEDVPGPPIIIYFPNVTYTSAVLVWSPPSEPNGIIKAYRVACHRQDSGALVGQSELRPTVLQYSEDTLERETYYEFSVTAKTRDWGETASVVVLTMLNRARPEKPSMSKVGSLQIQSRNVTIAWQPGADNYSPVRNFTIQYKLRDHLWTTFPHTIPPSANSYIVTGLRPNSYYQFRVAATNDMGSSDFSNASTEVMTQSDIPDTSPRNLKVVVVSRTSIRASWQPPAESGWNGPLEHYIVQYRQIQQQDWQEETLGVSTNSLLLTDLVIDQTYELQVLATNAKGWGPPSTPATIYVGEAAPTDSPSNVVAVNKSSSAILVTWVAPPPDTQNGGLSGYKVLFYKNSSSSATEEQRISAETELLLDGLPTFTTYFISVLAYNLAGDGPRSALVSATTSEGVPGAPGKLEFSNITMRQVTVSFQPPEQPNGRILLYEMEYFPSDNSKRFGTMPPRRVLHANETRVVVTGLEQEVRYQFSVTANTSIGRGKATPGAITTGPQSGSPRAPSKPSVMQEGNGLLLQWVDGAVGDSPTYGYFIQKRKQGEVPFVTLQQVITGESRALVSLTDLNPEAQYRFRIIAINDQGISPPSVPSDIFLTPSFARSEYPPEILKQPFAGQVVFEGNTKLLHCQVVAVPDPVFTWIKDDTPVHVNRTVNYLRLGNLSLSDSGVYRCLVSNKLGAVLSEGAHIRVAAFRQFSKTPPQEKTVDQGQSLILDLPPINTLLLTVSWQENNSTIRAHEAMHHSITLTHQLVLLSIDNNINNKQYRAMVEDSLSKGFLSFSSPYIIRVQDTNNPSIIHPQIVVPPVDTFANVGDNAKLKCVINARPMSGLSITWYRLYENGTKTRIESGGKYLLTDKRRLLYVQTITKSDSGTYVCEGHLTAGQTPIPSVSHSANLTVQVIPKITVNPRSSTVERDFGQEVTLACEAEGVPIPTLEWFFNGRPISSINSDRYQVFANGSLQMTHLDLPYSGKYQCFATNPAGETYLSVNLHINSAPPQITKFPENLTVVEKSDARFFCEVTGAPTPQIIWKKVAGGVEQPVTPGTRFQVTRSYLLITDVQKDDSGVYRCSAENIKGQQAAEAHLSVITKTQVVRPPQNQTVILSTRVSFECGVTRDEHTVPVWEWFFYKNSELSREVQLSSTGRYQILANGTLMVSDVSAQDIGLYKCHVISARGNDSRVALLSVIELPRPPTITSVQLNTNENNSVVVTWTKAFDGNSPLLKYIIIYRQENPNGNNDGVGWEVYPDRIPADATTYIVSNLSPSRYYRFRISAMNVVGESNGSQPMPNPAIKMPSQPPSSPPRNFFCTQGGQGEIRATWDPPDESTWNGDLQGYLLRYKVANLNTVLEEARVTGASKRSFLIQHLVPFEQYAVTIAAFNEEGTGASTNSFFVWTREGRPTDAPKNVVANASSSTVVQLLNSLIFSLLFFFFWGGVVAI